jgi:hypothetical protein
VGLGPLPGDAEVAAGRAAYEAFLDNMRPWIASPTSPTSWDEQASQVKNAWIVAAQAGHSCLALRKMTSSPAGLDIGNDVGAGTS